MADGPATPARAAGLNDLRHFSTVTVITNCRRWEAPAPASDHSNDCYTGFGASHRSVTPRRRNSLFAPYRMSTSRSRTKADSASSLKSLQGRLRSGPDISWTGSARSWRGRRKWSRPEIVGGTCRPPDDPLPACRPLRRSDESPSVFVAGSTGVAWRSEATEASRRRCSAVQAFAPFSAMPASSSFIDRFFRSPFLA